MTNDKERLEKINKLERRHREMQHGNIENGNYEGACYHAGQVSAYIRVQKILRDDSFTVVGFDNE